MSSTDVLNWGKVRVGVLRGGPSNEYDISLQSGLNVIRNLPLNCVPIDILISRDGIWHIGGIAKTPERAFSQVDLVFNALHGIYGEDGKIQGLLELHGVPFTGSGSFSSALGMNKVLSKKLFSAQGYKTPYHVVFDPKENTFQNIAELYKTFPQPSIIKPIVGGSSIGVTVANDFASFKSGIETALRYGPSALIEEYISGQEISVPVISSSDGETVYASVPVEIIKPEGKSFFDYESRSHFDTKRIAPAGISSEIKKVLQNISTTLHRVFGLRHYSNFDFIVHPKRGIYIIEVNTLPGLTEVSTLPISLTTSGSSLSELLEHTISSALQDKYGYK